MLEVFESNVTFEIEQVEAVPLSPDSSKLELESYPYPFLKLTGNRQKVELTCVVLENDYVQVLVAPSLGGRILRLLDKRTNIDAWPFSLSLNLTAGGQRGVELDAGMELLVHGRRKNALGPVDYMLDTADPEWAKVILFELGEGVSWHAVVGLRAGVAEVGVEARIYNRTMSPQPYNGGILAPLKLEANQNGATSFNQEARAGFGVWCTAGTMAGANGRSMTRLDEVRELAPHQVDEWQIWITPITGLPALTSASRSAALGLHGDKATIQSAQDFGNGKVVLSTGGSTLEAPIELKGGQSTTINIPGRPDGIAVLGVTGEVLVSTQPLPEDDVATTSRAVREASFDVGTRASSLTTLALSLLRAGQFAAAAEMFDAALLFNGVDPLNWLLKAITARLAGDEAEDRPELLNAHFLAPMEPALRAEAFLAQNSKVKEPSALVKWFADHPDAMCDVACLLDEAGLEEELYAWVDECLRHRDVPMLRYLLAAVHLKRDGGMFEAEGQVRLAAKAPINPPYPFRAAELRGLKNLAIAFPNDLRLADLMALSTRALLSP